MDADEHTKRDTLADDLSRHTKSGWEQASKNPDWVMGLDSLCAGCEHSQIMRRKGNPNFSVYCHSFSQNVPPDIEECNQFFAINRMTIKDMTMIATLLDTREQGGQYL